MVHLYLYLRLLIKYVKLHLGYFSFTIRIKEECFIIPETRESARADEQVVKSGCVPDCQ